MPQHPDRLIRLQGASNFRDLGGYVGHGGRPVRWRKLFRTDHLGLLTEADKTALAKLGLAQTFDFRGVAERAETPYQVPDVKQHSLAIEPTVAQHMHTLRAKGQPLTVPVVVGLMHDLYRSLVNENGQRYAELFEHLMQANAPLAFHCTAGKDRTGVAAALILLALGVPREVVMQDFLLTNQHYQHPPLVASDTPPESATATAATATTTANAAAATPTPAPIAVKSKPKKPTLVPAPPKTMPKERAEELVATRARYDDPTVRSPDDRDKHKAVLLWCHQNQPCTSTGKVATGCGHRARGVPVEPVATGLCHRLLLFHVFLSVRKWTKTDKKVRKTEHFSTHFLSLAQFCVADCCCTTCCVTRCERSLVFRC